MALYDNILYKQWVILWIIFIGKLIFLKILFKNFQNNFFFKFSQAYFKLVSNTHFCLTFIIRIDLKSTSIKHNYNAPIFCHPKKGEKVKIPL